MSAPNDNAIEGMRADEDVLSPLEVPLEYRPLSDSGLDLSQQDVAYLYKAYADDRMSGSQTASSFQDAVKQHHLIDRMFSTSAVQFK
jgi:hypothetical protein